MIPGHNGHKPGKHRVSAGKRRQMSKGEVLLGMLILLVLSFAIAYVIS